MANINLKLMGGKTDEDVRRGSFLEGMKSNTKSDGQSSGITPISEQHDCTTFQSFYSERLTTPGKKSSIDQKELRAKIHQMT